MRNVIMITTDQQQANAMGCLDNSYITPNLDRLAAGSIRYSTAVSTSAQCSPSRASWLTGKFPHQTGVYQIGHMLDPGEWGVAKAFSDAGYETVYFGKWHLGGSPKDHHFQIASYRQDPVELAGAKADPRYFSYRDAVTTAQAIHYLEDYAGTRPFFLNVNYYMPHPNVPEDYPFERIERYADWFPLERMPIPASFYRDDLSTKPSFQQERSRSGESKLDEELVRRDACHYRTMLALMDQYLGRLLDKLEDKGLLEETVILFTSDHGDMQGAHRLRLKGVLPYKELYQVPLLLRLPRMEGGRVIASPVSTAAIPGTLLEAAGLEVPGECQGGSLLPLLERDEPDGEEHVFFEHFAAYWGRHPFAGIQSQSWKYVLYLESGEEEMYDLALDPDELANVAFNPDVQEVRHRLRAKVEEWWSSTGAFTRQPKIDPNSNWGTGRAQNRGADR